MSSIGASYAQVYVQQKRQKERLTKKMAEDERARVINNGNININNNNVVIVDESKSNGRNKKIHPADN
ncbi:hypothetical protein ABFX02_12G009100 [Erythranthe guttata]